MRVSGCLSTTGQGKSKYFWLLGFCICLFSLVVFLPNKCPVNIDEDLDAYLMLGLNPTYLPTLPFTRILLVYHFQLHSRSEIGCCGILHETYFSFESSGIHTRINSGQILLGTTLLSLGYTLHWFSTIWRTYRVFEWKRPLVSMTASSSVTLLALWTLGRAGGPLFLLRRSTIN